MKRLFFLLFFPLVCFAADFDIIVVGTSPICLLEALYQHHLGKKVLVVEAAHECGGAWKSIDICGVQNVDMGCHSMGHDEKMASFLQEYIGCKIVSQDDPHLPYIRSNSTKGFYFSRGCFELVDKILERIKETDLVLLVDSPVNELLIDPDTGMAIAKINGESVTALKVLVTSSTELTINEQSTQSTKKARYHHLYLLIADPTPFQFTFINGTLNNVARMMNLTYFTGLEGTGKQLIVLQTSGEMKADEAENYMDQLKNQKLLDSQAKLLKAESYFYEHGRLNLSEYSKHKNVEILKTSHISAMSQYIDKWKQVLKPLGSKHERSD